MVTKFFCGGDKEDRTPDLLNAIQALSQYKRVRTPQHTLLRGRFDTWEVFSWAQLYASLPLFVVTFILRDMCGMNLYSGLVD